MKKIVVLVALLLCSAAIFAGSVGFQLGFSLMGVNAGTAVKVADNIKVGINASYAKVAEKDGFSWLYAQALLGIDTIQSESNDLDLRFGLTYLQTNDSETYYEGEPESETTTYENYMKYAGVTFGIQYTHWFGEKKSHGIFVGIDIPVGGYVSYVSYGSEIEHGPFVGPLTSMATLGVMLTSFRTGYCFQF